LKSYPDHSIEAWDSDVHMDDCDDTVIVPGDLLLIFSDSNTGVYIGRCSASRVIESILTALTLLPLQRFSGYVPGPGKTRFWQSQRPLSVTVNAQDFRFLNARTGYLVRARKQLVS